MKYDQKFLEDWQIEWYYKKKRRFIWLAIILFILSVIVSNFGN